MYAQYCTPSATSPCTANLGNETISNFTLGSINNNSACSPGNYEDFYSPTTYPSMVTTLNSPSSAVPYSVTALHADYQSSYAVAIWIDLDSNGTFDANERVAYRNSATDCNGNIFFPFCDNVVKAGTLDIPAGVSTGFKRLRVRLLYNGIGNTTPCAQIQYGEAEDYRVYIQGAVVTPPDVTVGSITPLNYCSGASISIPFTVSGTFTSGNVFTAQLSDSTGSFSSAVTIGTLTSTSSGTINGTIPANALHGTGYKIRIVASTPSTTGSVVSANITINESKPIDVTINASPSTTICQGSNVTFTATPVNGGTSPVYQWYRIPGSGSVSNSVTYSTNSLNNGDQVYCILTSNALCATSTTDTSSKLTITISGSGSAGSALAVSDSICSGEIAVVRTTGATGGIQWQSSTTGADFADIQNATDTSYSISATQTTFFRVHTTSGSCNDTSLVVQVTVKALPSPPAISTTDSLICPGDSTQICASGNFTSYQWNNNNGTGTCIQARQVGGYWVTATAANGCSNVSRHITVTTYPTSSVSIIVRGDTLASFGAVGYQWLRNDTIIAGATSNTYIVSIPGSYKVRITDANGCVAVSSAVEAGTIGINDPELEKEIELFPNPATGSFNIRYSGIGAHPLRLSLFNILGEKVREETLSFIQARLITINASSLAPGTYFAKIQSDQSFVTKMVVIK